MSAITVSHIKKYYQVYKSKPGFIPTLKGLLHRTYDTVPAVNDISFSIHEGELVGFIGPNGAGKTTTLKCLSGLLYPNGGEISVLGHYPYDRKKEFLQDIALVMGQKNQLWWDLPSIDTFLLNKEIYEISNSDFTDTLNELLTLLDGKNLLTVPVRKLSLGQRMRMELVAALLHKPKILFLDEPTIGLDVVMQQKVREFIREYNVRHNATILLTSHYMEDVRALCKRIIIIDRGTIKYDGLLSDIVREVVKHKNIIVVFDTYVDPKKLEAFGKIVEYNFPRAVFTVLRKDTNRAVSRILAEYKNVDIIIEEPTIEEIVRTIFRGKELS